MYVSTMSLYVPSSECRGVQNMWEKRTIWELGTRVPYMIHVPWLPQSHGQHTAGLTELIE